MIYIHRCYYNIDQTHSTQLVTHTQDDLWTIGLIFSFESIDSSRINCSSSYREKNIEITEILPRGLKGTIN